MAAGNGKYYLVPFPYPVGLDNDQRDAIVEGFLMPYASGSPDNAIFSITAFSITSNVATFTVNNTFTTGGGDSIYVAGFTGALAYLNGIYTTNSATATTVLVPLTHANVATTQAFALATITPTYNTGGLPVKGFLDYRTGQPIAVQTVANGATSFHWIDVQTSSASAYNYKTNFGLATPQIALFSGITEATGGSAIPFDQAYFRAEFSRNNY